MKKCSRCAKYQGNRWFDHGLVGLVGLAIDPVYIPKATLLKNLEAIAEVAGPEESSSSLYSLLIHVAGHDNGRSLNT